jgi:hypothetical protein
MPGRVYVLESSTFMRLPEGTDLDAIAAEHGGDVVGHLPDGEIVDAKIHAVRPATPEELAELAERGASRSWQPQQPGDE